MQLKTKNKYLLNMAKLGLQKPNKSQVTNAFAQTVGATAGFQVYEMAAQKLPITKQINLGILGASIVAQTMLKGTGIAKTIASALLVGISVNAGFTAAEDFGLLAKLNLAPVIANAEELNGLYNFDGVDYIQVAQVVDSPMASLSGMRNEVIQLM